MAIEQIRNQKSAESAAAVSFGAGVANDNQKNPVIERSDAKAEAVVKAAFQSLIRPNDNKVISFPVAGLFAKKK